MVGPITRPSQSNSIPVSAPVTDSNHIAHFIRSTSKQINGKLTKIMIQPFSDRTFILVTQIDKMGTIVSANRDVTIAGAETYNVTVLMGRRDIVEYELCARRIAAMMAEDGCSKSLLLSISLVDHSITTITAVIDTVKEMNTW